MSQLITGTAADQVATYTQRKLMNAHGHPRIGPLLQAIAPSFSQRFGICVAMPNPKGFHITSVERLIRYHDMLVTHAPGVRWLVKLYFTEQLTPAEYERAAELPYFAGLKYYPYGLTTNSEDGIRVPSMLWTPRSNPYEVMRAAAQSRHPTSFHGADGFDLPGVELDPYRQEEHFYNHTMPRILDAHPDGKNIGEHLSTITGAEFFRRNGSERLGCTITMHHATLDRRDVYRRGFNPMYFCWPTIQSAEHQEAMLELMLAGYSFVMFGDDGACHPKDAKESGCCAAGVNTTEASAELGVDTFAKHGKLHQFEQFSVTNGARFYNVEPANENVIFEERPYRPRTALVCDDGTEVLGFQMPDRDGSGSPPIGWSLAAG